ncbi:MULTISPECIES: GMC family oxidoreductase [unclassified Roseitalea]|uniref:GMC family oxidoreductase n=1 Tax=unclassified Roseitalea TaxID=2639107 RepID=UPI00273E6A36|nr:MULTISPECIES: GMC family oxidoreductase [unclassified Roseitalea]
MAVQPRKDVVVIGYGAAAGPVSLELAQDGRSVIVLESGKRRTTEQDFQRGSFDTLRWRTRGEMLPGPERAPMTYRKSEDEDALPASYIMASTVGGASVHWSGQSWRYYEDDFRVKSRIEELYGDTGRLDYLQEDRAAIQDWPISYDEVEPFYEKAEWQIGIGGWPGNIDGEIRPVNPEEGNPYEAPRKRDYPFRPLRDNATDLTFRQGALELGLRPFHVPTAITTETWTSDLGITRPGCTYCAFCTSHGCWNASKSSSLVSLLPAAEELDNFEIRTEAHVIRLNHENGRVTSVTYVDEQGDVHEQPGDIFILGAYTFQNVRLMLHSGIDANGQIGKYFINRPSIKVSATFDDRYLNGWNGPAVQRQGVDDFNGENIAERKLELAEDAFFIRGAFIGSPSQRFPLQTFGDHPDDIRGWGAEYKDYFTENLNRYISLQLLMEPLPYEDNYIDLDPNYTDRFGVPAARVTNRVHSNEERMGRFIHDRGVEILEAAGASRIWGRAEATARPTMTHDLGGARMGDDPANSATNRYCQVWTMPNLFVGGGAVAPTMSGHNPTETIWMLSYWMSDAIRNGKVNLDDASDFS